MKEKYQREIIEALQGPAIVISKESCKEIQENSDAKQNQERLEKQRKYFKNIVDTTQPRRSINIDKVKNAINKLSHIVDIKIEISEVNSKYSIIVLYGNDSDIIICDSETEASMIFNYLTDKINTSSYNYDNEGLER